MSETGYPWTDDELLAWARAEVREPWERICRVAGRIAAGEDLSLAEAKVRIPLTPFTADYRALYYLMRDVGGLATWDPGNLFTIILDGQGRRILRAYLERVRDNNYVEIVSFDPDTPWVRETEAIIASGDLHPLREHLDDRVREETGAWVNWVKVANIHFFGVFRRFLTEWEAGEKTLASYLDAVTRAVRIIYEQRWIRFEPTPPLFATLEEWVTRILEFDPEKVPWSFLLGEEDGGKKRGRAGGESRVVFAVKGRDYLAAFQHDPGDPFHITCDPQATRAAEDLDLARVPGALARKTEAGRVLAVRAEPLANLVYEVLYRRYPGDREDVKTIVGRALEIVRRYPEHWSLHPLPFYLRGWARALGRFLGAPIDIRRLAVRDLAHVLVEGPLIFMGICNQRVFGVLEGDRLRLLVSVHSTDGAIRRVRLWDPDEFQDLLTGLGKDPEDAKARAIAVKHRIWERYEWVDLIVLVRTEMLAAAGRLISPDLWRSPWRLWRLPFRRRRVRKLAAKAGLIGYPDLLLREFRRWAEKRGRAGILWNATKAAFDQGPRPRGRLYWKGPLIAAAFALGLAGLAATLFLL